MNNILIIDINRCANEQYYEKKILLKNVDFQYFNSKILSFRLISMLDFLIITDDDGHLVYKSRHPDILPETYIAGSHNLNGTLNTISDWGSEW